MEVFSNLNMLTREIIIPGFWNRVSQLTQKPQSWFAISQVVSPRNWYEKFKFNRLLEKDWGVQGFLKVELEVLPFEVKMGFAVVNKSFPVSQNRHIHPNSGEIVAVWTQNPDSCVIEYNGNLELVKGNFAVIYFPPGIPHNLIFNGPAVTIDPKSLCFDDRIDNLPEGIRSLKNDSVYIGKEYMLINDPVYDFPWLIGNLQSINGENDSSIGSSLELQFGTNWQILVFNPRAMLDDIGLLTKESGISDPAKFFVFPKYQTLNLDHFNGLQENFNGLQENGLHDCIYFAFPNLNIIQLAK